MPNGWAGARESARRAYISLEVDDDPRTSGVEEDASPDTHTSCAPGETVVVSSRWEERCLVGYRRAVKNAGGLLPGRKADRILAIKLMMRVQSGYARTSDDGSPRERFRNGAALKNQLLSEDRGFLGIGRRPLHRHDVHGERDCKTNERRVVVQRLQRLLTGNSEGGLGLDKDGTGTGIRTPVPWLRTTCPDP